jgi:hypothetical protein
MERAKMNIQEMKAELAWMAKEGFLNKSAYKARSTWLLREIKKLEGFASV